MGVFKLANRWLKKEELTENNEPLLDSQWLKDFFFGVGIGNISNSEFVISTSTATQTVAESEVP